jgi:hypothetical protein
MSRRVAVGGVEHETTSFIPEPTPLEEFARRTVSGDDLARLGDANTIVDGFVKGVGEHRLQLVPLSWAKANAGGPPTRETFETLAEDLLGRLQRAVPVDGVLLSLHGSYAAEGIDDADGEILKRVRQLVGPDCPIMSVHDLHSNISAQMVEVANALIIERTYPHIDMAQRAIDAVALMARTISGEIRPTMAYRSLPILWAAPKMIDAEPPMSEAVAQLARLDCQPGVLSASIGVGYQWIDSPLVGASTVVVTDNDEVQAQQLATRWLIGFGIAAKIGAEKRCPRNRPYSRVTQLAVSRSFWPIRVTTPAAALPAMAPKFCGCSSSGICSRRRCSMWWLPRWPQPRRWRASGQRSMSKLVASHIPCWDPRLPCTPKLFRCPTVASPTTARCGPE